MLGYHFTADTLRDGRPIPPIGEWLEHTGPIVPCKSGLHASEHPFDALQFAPGSMLHHVELEGDLVPHGDPVDKWVGRRRRRNATIDATDLLREFARWCALQVVDLWDGPPVVREYLETGDETKRETARAAASDFLAARTTWTTERDAKAAVSARATATATGTSDWEARASMAARAASWCDAGWDATRANDAARSVVWTIRAEASGIIRAAEATAWSARTAVGWSARTAAGHPGTAAGDAQRDQFAAMVEAAFATPETLRAD
jgi:hypothetical protein